MPTGNDLLNKAKELTQYDPSINRGKSIYVWGGTGKDVNKDGVPDFDCTGLITDALRELGYDVPRLTTSSIPNSKFFEEISPDQAQPGDIIIFERGGNSGHAGIVEYYDASSGKGKFFGMQNSGAYSASFGNGKDYWNQFPFRIYRFKPFESPSNPHNPPPTPSNFYNFHPTYAEKVRQNLKEGTRRIDPLVIDLNGDGIKLTDIKESRAMFDLSASGFANRVGMGFF